MFIILCQKNQDSNLWCFDYSFSEELEVSGEPLMHQATAVIDAVLAKRYAHVPEVISIIFDHVHVKGADVVIEYKEPSLGGSLYVTTEVSGLTEKSDQDVWLCSVLTYFYPDPPKKLYVLITEEEEMHLN